MRNLLVAIVLSGAVVGCGGGSTSPRINGSPDNGGGGNSQENTAPVATADSATVSTDSENNSIDVLANDADVDGDDVSLTTVPAASTSGTVSRDDNGTANDQTDDKINYTPNADFDGQDSFQYSISDGNGGTSTATVTITVVRGNTAPVANADSTTVDAGSEANSIDVLVNDTDADGDDLQLTTIPAMTNGSGTLTRDDNGTADDQTDDKIDYRPNPSFQGEDTFEYGISDGNGGTDTATVTITVVRDNSNPDPGTGCRDKQTRLDSGLGYCFDASFNTEHDDTLIDMTVYVPHPDNLAIATVGMLAEDELGYAPLVIHSHGFGGSKNTDFEVEPGHFVDNQAALELWQNGYFVISFSERGFGQSGGQIGFMDPTKEGQDQNEVLDWAIKHLRGPSTIGGDDGIYSVTFDAADANNMSSVAVDDDRPSLLMNDAQSRLQIDAAAPAGDPSVGTLGYSYGGGFQYTFSHTDTDDITDRNELERLDALIPEGTWHDLRYSLHSNDTPKGYWATLLFSFAVQGGTLSNGQPVPPFLIDVYQQAVTQGRVSAANQNILGGYGTSFYCDENNGATTEVALLHIQGVRDTLFDFNDGYSNVKCFADKGNDARYLAVSGGHPLTVSQQPIYTGQTTSMDIDEVIHCGIDATTGKPKRLIVKDLMIAWFEEKLRGQAGEADVVPKFCINQENTDSTDFLTDDNFSQKSDANSFNYLKEGVTGDSVYDIKVGALSPNEVTAVATPSYECDGDAGGFQCPIDVLVPLASPPLTESQFGVQVFVPLYTESATLADGSDNTGGRVMAGIPTVKLNLEIGGSVLGQYQAFPEQSTDLPFHVFVGVGLKRGDVNPVILHDQLTPIRQTFTYPYAAFNHTVSTDGTEVVRTENMEPIHYGCGYDAESLCDRGWLAGATTRILPGDQIGLIFTPSDVQYQQLVNLAIATLKITGDAEFPIYPPSPLPASNNPQP